MQIDMKDLLRRMMTGWMLHENSWDSRIAEYGRSPQDCAIEACDGDKLAGELLYLFGHWSNDIQEIAAHYGLAIINREVQEIPIPPGQDYYWDKGQWNKYDEPKTESQTS